MYNRNYEKWACCKLWGNFKSSDAIIPRIGASRTFLVQRIVGHFEMQDVFSQRLEIWHLQEVEIS